MLVGQTKLLSTIDKYKQKKNRSNNKADGQKVDKSSS